MAKVRGVLVTYTFYESDVRGEARLRQWLAAALGGSPKFTREPLVNVVLDTGGNEIQRTSFGAISDEFKDYVEDQLTQLKRQLTKER